MKVIKKIIQYAVVFIIGLMILNVIAEIFRSMAMGVEGIVRIDEERLWNYFYISLLSILFGILIEWKRVLKILKGDINFNWLIIPTVIFLIISLTPHTYTFRLVGIASYRHTPLGVFFAPMQYTHILIMIGILTGVMLVRSFKNET
ncbi:hypothetical protein [Pontibacillus sp. HMF3514]|uniref:hypothetical protein n=1 Tax=Pontibacillus sp. HMF3514 TaxID=2692425 RepID=UPI00132053CD|nr:hypothetical protein [Pontibacillus sp. HMF3514]QHE52719.1 hypothetical protein GS400_12060 [Pontibacillus sp. HMF3514]